MSLLEMLTENRNIVKIKSPEEEPFTLKSGKKSRFFIDIKYASTKPLILREIVDALHWRNQYNGQTMSIEDFEVIASVAVGGVPIASALSYRSSKPQIIVRSEKHDTGTKSQVIGDCKDKTCIVIEDVATTGGSLVNAVKAIRDAGGLCHNAIVIVDREEGANRLCGQNNIKLYSLLKKSDFGLKEE